MMQVLLYIRIISSKNNIKVELNISDVGTGAGESSGKGNFTDNIEDKYYKTAIYKKLSKKQREEHVELRKKRK